MIPFQRMHHSGKEIEYVGDAVRRGQVSGDGHYTGLAADFIRKRFGAGQVFMTTSATHALELSMLLIGLKPGDEVIMPSFTFSSTANAVLLRGARPVFAEIDERTLNMDPASVGNRISPASKAILPVHYAGIGCDMDAIMPLAAQHGLYVIEDAAQAVNARYKGRYLGSIGHMGCYSFHGTKNYTCGEGGALLLNMEAPALADRADCIRQKGTDRSRFLRGEAASYSWVDIGSSYSPSDVLMALLYAQLEDMEEITAGRKRVHAFYCNILEAYVRSKVLRVIDIPPECESNYHIFYLIFHDGGTRDHVLKALNGRGIAASFHFMPLHGSPMGKSLGYRQGDLEVTERISRCILRLPVYSDMSNEEMAYVGEHLTNILEAL